MLKKEVKGKFDEIRDLMIELAKIDNPNGFERKEVIDAINNIFIALDLLQFETEGLCDENKELKRKWHKSEYERKERILELKELRDEL